MPVQPPPTAPPKGGKQTATGSGKTPSGAETKGKEEEPTRKAASPAQVTAQKNSVKGFKANLTRQLNSAQLLVTQARMNIASPTCLLHMKNIYDTTQTAFDRLEEAINRLAEMDDPAHFDEYIGDLDTRADALDDCHIQINDVLSQMEAAGIAQPAAALPNAGDNAPRTKPNTALRPKILLKDATPVEFSKWARDWRAYYTSSRMDLNTVEEQQAYLRACIDAHLDSRTQALILPATPIYSDVDTSCMEILQLEFVKANPIFNRRLEFFRAPHHPGTPFSDFINDIHAKGDEANLADLQIDDLYVFRYIVACSDNKLREKFLREKDPTVPALRDITGQHELAAKAEKSLKSGSGSASANYTTSRGKGKGKGGKGKGRGGGQQQQQQSTQPTSVSSHFSVLRAAGKCFRCGSTNPQHECKAATATCSKCQRTGHFAAVCCQPKDGQDNSQSSSSNRGRGCGHGGRGRGNRGRGRGGGQSGFAGQTQSAPASRASSPTQDSSDCE